jgi:hypothetical protein
MEQGLRGIAWPSCEGKLPGLDPRSHCVVSKIKSRGLAGSSAAVVVGSSTLCCAVVGCLSQGAMPSSWSYSTGEDVVASAKRGAPSSTNFGAVDGAVETLEIDD